MNPTKEDRRKHPRKVGISRKKNALVIFNDGKEFWTTQNQFWQWVRDRLIVKAGDNPLRGKSVIPNQPQTIVANNNVMGLPNQNYSQESLIKKE